MASEQVSREGVSAVVRSSFFHRNFRPFLRAAEAQIRKKLEKKAVSILFYVF